MPSGRQVKAARALLGLQQHELAARAGVDPATLSRFEACGLKPIRGLAQNIAAVIGAIEKAGVELTADGVRYLKPPRR